MGESPRHGGKKKKKKKLYEASYLETLGRFQMKRLLKENKMDVKGSVEELRARLAEIDDPNAPGWSLGCVGVVWVEFRHSHSHS